MASAMMSMKVLAPSFRFARGSPCMLLERSRVRTMSVGSVIISGAAVRDNVTSREPSQAIWFGLMVLLELVTPI